MKRTKSLIRRILVPVMLAAAFAFPVQGRQNPGVGHSKAQQVPSAEAREFPRWEWFWGFSYLNISLGSQSSLFAPTSPNYYGIRTALKLNLRKEIGVLLDAGGGYGQTRPASRTSRIPDSSCLALSSYSAVARSMLLLTPSSASTPQPCPWWPRTVLRAT